MAKKHLTKALVKAPATVATVVKRNQYQELFDAFSNVEKCSQQQLAVLDSYRKLTDTDWKKAAKIAANSMWGISLQEK